MWPLEQSPSRFEAPELDGVDGVDGRSLGRSPTFRKWVIATVLDGIHLIYPLIHRKLVSIQYIYLYCVIIYTYNAIGSIANLTKIDDTKNQQKMDGSSLFSSLLLYNC